jgi:hypothetical protein
MEWNTEAMRELLSAAFSDKGITTKPPSLFSTVFSYRP